MKLGIIAGAAALALTAGAAHAEVADLSPTGFTLVQTATVKAPADKVYAALVDIGKWWNPAHSYSGKAANITIDAKPGGCWCEALSGGGVEHMRVVFVSPGKMLRFQGGLGPLQTSGVSGAMDWTLAEKDGVTTVTWTYSIGGYFKGGFNELAPGVDFVVGEQLGRFKRYVETGKPTP